MPAQGKPSGGKSARVCLGVIAAPHGVRGRVRIKTFTSDPDNIAAYGPVSDEAGGRTFNLTLTGRAKGGVLAAIEGIEDRDAAAELKGTKLYVGRVALPEPGEDEFYHGDLIGLAVELADGSELGRVKGIHDLGAGDILEVAIPGRDTVLLPFTKAVVPEIDIEGGRLVVTPPEELLEEVKG